MAREPGKKTKQRKRERQEATSGAGSWLRQSPEWPLYEVLLSEEWDDVSNLATMVVARQSPRSGKIAVASFLVDLGCLGVKSSFVRICKSPDDYVRRVRNSLEEQQRLEPSTLHLVAKIVRDALSYAERLGFAPDPEYHHASTLLKGADPDACDEQVPLGGPDGKPLYIPSPYDNVDQIMATLIRAVGEEGFVRREDEPPLLPGMPG